MTQMKIVVLTTNNFPERDQKSTFGPECAQAGTQRGPWTKRFLGPNVSEVFLKEDPPPCVLCIVYDHPEE